MTTVAYKDGVIASDSALTYGNAYIGTSKKVWKFGTGALYGICGMGDDRPLRRLLEKVKTEDELPSVAQLQEVKGDMEALFILPDGQVFSIATDENASVFPVEDAHHAIGRGRKFAIGAMDAGADAIKAADIGSHRDINSGGSIQVLYLDSWNTLKVLAA